MRRILVAILMALVLVSTMVMPVLAVDLDYAEVTIDAIPEYLAINNSVDSWNIGPVAANSTVWWTATGAPPTEEGFIDTEMKSAATNTGSIDSNINVHTHDFTGTAGWTLDTTVGENKVVLAFGKTGTVGKANMLKLVDTTPQELAHELAPAGHIDWCMYLDTGTFTEGSAKSTTVTLTITKHT